MKKSEKLICSLPDRRGKEASSDSRNWQRETSIRRGAGGAPLLSSIHIRRALAGSPRSNIEKNTLGSQPNEQLPGGRVTPLLSRSGEGSLRGNTIKGATGGKERGIQCLAG